MTTLTVSIDFSIIFQNVYPLTCVFIWFGITESDKGEQEHISLDIVSQNTQPLTPIGGSDCLYTLKRNNIKYLKYKFTSLSLLIQLHWISELGHILVSISPLSVVWLPPDHGLPHRPLLLETISLLVTTLMVSRSWGNSRLSNTGHSSRPKS